MYLTNMKTQRPEGRGSTNTLSAIEAHEIIRALERTNKTVNNGRLHGTQVVRSQKNKAKWENYIGGHTVQDRTGQPKEPQRKTTHSKMTQRRKDDGT